MKIPFMAALLVFTLLTVFPRTILATTCATWDAFSRRDTALACSNVPEKTHGTCPNAKDECITTNTDPRGPSCECQYVANTSVCSTWTLTHTNTDTRCNGVTPGTNGGCGVNTCVMTTGDSCYCQYVADPNGNCATWDPLVRADTALACSGQKPGTKAGCVGANELCTITNSTTHVCMCQDATGALTYTVGGVDKIFCPDGWPDDPHVKSSLGCIPVKMDSFVKWLLPYLFGIAGGISFLLMVSGFIQMTLSSGDPKAVQAAQETVTSAIIGLIVSIFALFLLRLIAVNILHIPGIN